MSADLDLFAAVTTAIVMEAAPFLLFGALVGSLVEVLVAARTLERLAPRSLGGQVLLGLLGGLALPTCECGVVPVVRRFLARGMPPGAALAYMLAAPVINPVVLASTWVAFRGDWAMVLGRAGLVALVAGFMGFLLGRARPEDVLCSLLPECGPGHVPSCACGHDHHHGHSPDQDDPHQHEPDQDAPQHHAPQHHAPKPHDNRSARPSRLMAVLGHTGHEFLTMGVYLILGAMAAAAIKTWVPAGALLSLADSPWLAVGAMMLLAVLLSVCSEADAFVAASFVTFSPAAKLAFLALGPMLDLKLVGMYSAAFQRRVVFILCLVPALLIFGACMMLSGLGWGNLLVGMSGGVGP